MEYKYVLNTDPTATPEPVHVINLSLKRSGTDIALDANGFTILTFSPTGKIRRIGYSRSSGLPCDPSNKIIIY
jgi:hypothetical protein